MDVLTQNLPGVFCSSSNFSHRQKYLCDCPLLHLKAIENQILEANVIIMVMCVCVCVWEPIPGIHVYHINMYQWSGSSLGI